MSVLLAPGLSAPSLSQHSAAGPAAAPLHASHSAAAGNLLEQAILNPDLDEASALLIRALGIQPEYADLLPENRDWKRARTSRGRAVMIADWIRAEILAVGEHLDAPVLGADPNSTVGTRD